MSGKSSVEIADPAGDPADHRAYFRWTFRGTAFPCRAGKKEFEIRLKDLSRGGACGLVDEPMVVGDYFFVHLDDRHVVEAQVCWVRRVMIGVRFNQTLSATFVTGLHERASKHDEAEQDDYLIAIRPRRTAGRSRN